MGGGVVKDLSVIYGQGIIVNIGILEKLLAPKKGIPT